MSDDESLEVMRDALPKLSRMKSVLRFDLGDAGGYTIDARSEKAVLVDDGSIEPDCTIKVSRENMLKLVSGDMDPILAYTLGRIKVQGSMDVAMKLVKALG